MSMHAIEDLVEETAHLVDRSVNFDLNTKRNLLYNMYRLQEMFDTSYTHFRVIDILLGNHFVYQITPASYPQLKLATTLPTDGKNGWVNDADGNTIAYALNDNGTVNLYADAGSQLWKHLCEMDILPKADHQSPQKLPVTQTVKTLMLEAAQQQETTLLKQWYSFLANAILEGDFGETEGIPTTFPDLLKDDDFTELRDLAVRNEVSQQQSRRRSDDYLSFPGLKVNLMSASGIEEIYRTRYLLDLSKSSAKLEDAYRKELLATAQGPEKIKLIQPVIHHYLAPLGWNYVEIIPDKKWLWYQDIADEKYNGPGHRQFIQVELDVQEKTLFCKLALQHSLILKWQEKKVTLLPEDWHFFYELSGWLPDEFRDKNKHLSDWGSWKVDLKQSEKILRSHLENLVEALKISDYFEFLQTEFPGEFSTRDPQQVLHLLEEGEGEFGIIPRYVVFDSKITTLIAFAKCYMEKNDSKNAEKMVNQIREIAENERVNPLQRKVVIDPILHQWKEKREVWFPPVWQNFLYQSLREKEDKAKQLQG
ncbi:hypothetical protein ACSBL2_10505 [Pedobacter sp. AW31-3R]|uniref:hypothetical protein n=1 Tax=Pedobacter sp. AW31-3R TaxID=3445781 RepID=UPI003F9FFE44